MAQSQSHSFAPRGLDPDAVSEHGLAMLWSDTPIHMIDFEGSTASGIVEYGVVTLLHGAIYKTATRLCRPTGRIRKEDTEVHGLEAGDLETLAPFSADFDRFATWRKEGPLAAHFAQAENSLIKSVWPFSRESPHFAKLGKSTCEWGPWIDTAWLYRELFGPSASGGLSDLVARFRLQNALDSLAPLHCPAGRCRYHAAPYDALAAALLLLQLGERAEFTSMTIPWLLQMSTPNAIKRAELRQGEWLFD